MIVWSGLGFLVPLTWVILAITASELDFNSYVPKPGSSALILTATGLLSLVYGLIIRKKAQNPKAHSFFFIRMEYWSVLLCIFAILIYVHSDRGWAINSCDHTLAGLTC